MNRVVVLGVIFLFVASSVISISGFNVEQSTTVLSDGITLYVGGSGGGNYTKIQEAIDNASDGDTVYVYNGTYVENLVINKSISLIGENRNNTVIEYFNPEIEYILIIYADKVNIQDFTIQRSKMIGIFLKSNNNTISNNRFSQNFYGVCAQSNNNTIIGNIFDRNYHEAGILFEGACDNLISDNYFFYNGLCIFFFDSKSNNISYNNFLNNGDGIRFIGKSNNNTITKNKISWNSRIGIWLQCFGKNNNVISHNTISSNGKTGLYFESSSNNNIIMENNISYNFIGIELKESCHNNSIYYNNFDNNGDNAFDECNNFWDDGKYGNYWSDYEERYPDAKKKSWKGIWNTPYEIPDGDNKDMRPLINQYPKSVIKSKSIDKPFNFNFSILNWLIDRFPNAIPILRKIVGLT